MINQTVIITIIYWDKYYIYKYKEVCPSTWRVDRSKVKHILKLAGKIMLHATEVIRKTDLIYRHTFKTYPVKPCSLKYWLLYSEQGNKLLLAATSWLEKWYITSSFWWRRCVSKTHKILNQGEQSSPEQGTCCWSATHPPQCKTLKNQV